MIINEILWIKQLFFSNVTLLSTNEVTQLRSLAVVSVVFNVSSSHANANAANRRFFARTILNI